MRRKRKIKVPAAKFGLSGSDIAQAAVAGGGMIANSAFGTSTATTQSLSNQLTAAGIMNGAAMGALIAGPWGALAGAAIGSIGQKGKKASMTSFTDYDEGTLGTGIIGAASNHSLRKERRRIKLNAYNNRAAVEGTSNLEADYMDDYNSMSLNSFAEGGTIPSQYVYVNDGEKIQQPNGSIQGVPEMGQPTDSNLVNLPVGSRVLSDTLKVPGTKETFAKTYDKMKAKTTNNKDRFAQNSEKLNKMNNERLFNLLFEQQELLKKKRGIKPKYKDAAIPAAEDGLATGKKGIDKLFFQDKIDDFNKKVEFNNANNRFLLDMMRKDKNAANRFNDKMNSVYNIVSSSGQPDIEGTLDNENKLKDKEEDNKENKNNKFNWSDLLTGLSSLVPAVGNLGTTAESVRGIYNPYSNAVRSTLRNRRYNAYPEIEAINKNRAVNLYNLNQYNTNTGMGLAATTLSAMDTNRAILQTMANANNINNQYFSDYANTLNQQGEVWAGEERRVQDFNAQNRAAARNIRRQGLADMSKIAQSRELMKNLRERDLMMWPLYEQFLKAGFTEDTIKNIDKYIHRV